MRKFFRLLIISACLALPFAGCSNTANQAGATSNANSATRSQSMYGGGTGAGSHGY